MPEVVREPAPAKLNPVLRVLGRREDGFHEIETVVLPLSLADGLEARSQSGGVTLAVVGPRAGSVPSGEDNLALRAARVLAEAARSGAGAALTLVKRIPVGAGLGGGSADAAAALRALNDVWALGWSSRRLAEVGAGVGSDVPALVLGGPAIARGRGDLVRSLRLPKTWWVLVVQPFEIPAGDAYRWWDEAPLTGPPVDGALAALRSGDVTRLADALSNDLQTGVLRHHPGVARARRAVLDAGALAALVSGSGPTVAGLCRDGAHAEVVAGATGGTVAASLSH